MGKKILWNPETFFCFCFILYKEKMLTDKVTVKSWNRGWAKAKSYLFLLIKVFYRLKLQIFKKWHCGFEENIKRNVIHNLDSFSIFYKYFKIEFI